MAFARKPEFLERVVVTRSEYLESGSNASHRKFRDWKYDEKDKEELKDLIYVGKGKGRMRDEGQDGVEMPAATKKLARNKARGSMGSIRRR